jgi:hypothetical protein
MSNFYLKKIDFSKGKINIPFITDISFLNNSISINVDIDNEPDLEPIKSILRKRKNKSILKEEYKMINNFIKHLSGLNIDNILIKKTSDIKESIELNLKKFSLQIKRIYWVHIDDNKYNNIKLSFIENEENESTYLKTLIETNYKESIDDYNYRIILELKNNLFLYIKGIYNTTSFNKKEESRDKIIICVSSKYNYLIHYFLTELEYCYYMQETEYIDNE